MLLGDWSPSLPPCFPLEHTVCQPSIHSSLFLTQFIPQLSPLFSFSFLFLPSSPLHLALSSSPHLRFHSCLAHSLPLAINNIISCLFFPFAFTSFRLTLPPSHPPLLTLHPPLPPSPQLFLYLPSPASLPSSVLRSLALHSLIQETTVRGH